MKKSDLRSLLQEKIEEYKLLVDASEPVCHPGPAKPPKLQLGTAPVVPDNLVEQEWQQYLAQLKAGTYQPDTDYQSAPRPKYEKKVKRPDTIGPRWRDGEDGRGYKSRT